MKVIDVDLTFQRVTDDGAVTTNDITTADILLTNQSGSNNADAGNLYFIESGTGWGSGVTGFRFHHDGSTNLLTLQAGNTSTVTDVLSIERDTADVGIGTVAPTARLHIASDATTTGESLTVENGSSETTLQLLDDGTFKLPKYGAGTFTGTATKTLAVDSSGNVIEIDGGGTIDGSGTANFITKWVDTDTLTDSVMYEDNSKIGIGTGAVEPSEALEVVGNVEAEEFIGDLRGSVLFKAQAGENIDKGEVVYISGISGNTTIVSLADANDAAKMPAFGVAAETITSGNPIDIYTFGILTGLDTSTPGFSLGDSLYVSTIAGVLVNAAPNFESAQIQKIAKVTRVHASQGSIFIAGAGRSNATPNLDKGKLFVGDANFQTVADDTVYIDIANSKVGINQTSPGHTLEVIGAGNTESTSTLSIQNSDNDDMLRVKDDGKLFLGNYGNNTFTGTVEKYLAVDLNGNVIEDDGVASPSEALFVYNSVGATSVGTSGATLFMDTEGFNSSATVFNLTSNVITVSADIRAYVSYTSAYASPTSTRTSITAFVEVSTDGGSNWNEVDGSRSFAYVRQGVNNDDSSSAGSFIRTTSSGDKYRLRAISAAGSVQTVAGGTSFNIMDLKGGQQGPEGPQGGVDGTGTTSFLPKWSDSDTLTNSIVFEDGTNTRIGVNQTTPDSTLHVKGTTDDGTTNIFKFNNNTDIDRLYMNGAGRLHLETDNTILMSMNRPGEQPVLNFQNNSNEGAIGYAGNGGIRFSTGIVQRSGTEFDFAIGQGTGTFEASTKALTIKQGQQIQFNQYGAGANENTPEYLLGVDSSGNVVEINEERGSFSGTTDFAGRISLSHGLGVTPTMVQVTMDDNGGTVAGNISVTTKSSTTVSLRSSNTSTTISGYYIVSA